MTIATQVGIGAVRIYQWTIRPVIGTHCRFWPSCSEYAIEALRVHGAARGSVLATKRILRCNPWHEGGVDPVPGTGRREHDAGPEPEAERVGSGVGPGLGIDGKMRH